MTSRNSPTDSHKRPRAPVAAMLMPLLLSVLAPVTMIAPVTAQDDGEGLSPQDIWSDEYAFQVFPWGGDSRVQFREYHDYFSMKERMQILADQNTEIMTFHEGMPGGLNARGDQTCLLYTSPSPRDGLLSRMPSSA